jgi:hypothetical protein
VGQWAHVGHQALDVEARAALLRPDRDVSALEADSPAEVDAQLSEVDVTAEGIRQTGFDFRVQASRGQRSGQRMTQQRSHQEDGDADSDSCTPQDWIPSHEALPRPVA